MRVGPCLLALTVATVALPPSAEAVGTRTFILDSLEEFSGGDLKGVSVSSEGGVRAGWSLGNVPLPDSSASFSALTLADGSYLVGTSPDGKVFKVTGDRAAVFAETKALAVTAMVEGAGGVVYAASMPDGKIFKLTAGKVEVLTTLPDTSHVWALAFDKTRRALYAATGPEGKVYRVELGGAHSVYYRCDEPHLVSLAVADNGDVFAGSSGKGLLYRITGPGRATVFYDFPGEEVKSLAFGKNGELFAVSNDYGEPPEAPKRSSSAGRLPAGPASTTARPKPGKGALYKFDAVGRPERLMKHDEFHYVSLAVDAEGRPHVGTGAEGRIYTVDDAHTVTLVADTEERQVGAIGFSRTGPFVATSDPVVFHRVVGQGGTEALWTSKVFDAGLRARFGQVAWRASGALEVSTRTGNTQVPDATWSAWNVVGAGKQPSPGSTAAGVVASPNGRFVQIRARWGRDPRAVLNEVTLPFVTENVRAVVTEVSAAPKSGGREGSKEGLVASGGEPPKHDTVLKMTWKVDNPDADALRYRLNYKKEGQNVWRDVLRDGEVVSKAEYEWETLAVPEGKYRLRVEASDEVANPPGDVQKHQLVSDPVLIDNTPPVIKELTVAGRRLRARVADGMGPVARVEVAVDARLEWRPLAPADGVMDSAEEAFDSDITTIVPAGSHVVTVRAYDAAGNSTLRDVEVP